MRTRSNRRDSAQATGGRDRAIGRTADNG